MTRVLVTGGGTGIGLGIVAALVAQGHDVVISGRRNAVLQAAARETGARALAWDITDDPAALIDAAGPLTHLINNAGHTCVQPVGKWTAAAFEELYAVHAVAPALLSQAFAAQASEPGCIVNIASTLADRPAPGMAAYSAAKAAMVSLTRSLALELAPRGLRANALLPGVVATAMTAERAQSLVGLHPLGRLGQPADIGAAVAWLLQADWVTGAAIPVDGGLLTRE